MSKSGKFFVKDDFATETCPKDAEKCPQNFYHCIEPWTAAGQHGHIIKSATDRRWTKCRWTEFCWTEHLPDPPRHRLIVRGLNVGRLNVTGLNVASLNTHILFKL